MISYDPRGWRHLLQAQGSVFPRSCGWGLLAAVAAVVVNNQSEKFDWATVDDRVTQAWFAYSSILGFLIIFRTNQAYSRYWEGVTLLHKTKGDWLNAMSAMVAFCTSEPTRYDEVSAFQHMIVRMMSLLHCAALQQVACMQNKDFDIIDLGGLEQDRLTFLSENGDNKCLILLQWIQKSIIKGMQSGILPVAPPIMTRVFQQLGNGYTNLIDAQKIADIPFPFPYDQMVTILLLCSTFFTPIVVGRAVADAQWACVLTFAGVCGLWSMNLIAAEIEMPFGDDRNDLPIAEIQQEMNRDLKVLMQNLAQQPPEFKFNREYHSILEEIPCDATMSVAMERSINITRAKSDNNIAQRVMTAKKARAQAARQSVFSDFSPISKVVSQISMVTASEFAAKPTSDSSTASSQVLAMDVALDLQKEKKASPRDASAVLHLNEGAQAVLWQPYNSLEIVPDELQESVAQMITKASEARTMSSRVSQPSTCSGYHSECATRNTDGSTTAHSQDSVLDVALNLHRENHGLPEDTRAASHVNESTQVKLLQPQHSLGTVPQEQANSESDALNFEIVSDVPMGESSTELAI